MPHVLALPAELTIYTAAELRTQWLAWIADIHDDVRIDGAAVDQADAAGVQLLASLARSVLARGCRWTIATPSDVLRSACLTLGLDRVLDDLPGAAR